MSRIMSLGFLIRSDMNRAVQQQMARGLKFWIYEVEGLYHLCTENKGADQLHDYCSDDLRLCFSHMQKNRFFHDIAHLMIIEG